MTKDERALLNTDLTRHIARSIAASSKRRRVDFSFLNSCSQLHFGITDTCMPSLRQETNYTNETRLKRNGKWKDT